MSQVVSSTSCGCFPVDRICSALESACTAIAEFAQEVLKNLGLVLDGLWDAPRWNRDNKSRFQASSPFIFSSPPRLSAKQSFPDGFEELAIAYQQLEHLAHKSAFCQAVNRKLVHGFCHGECAALVKAAQEKSLSIRESLNRLDPTTVTFQQTLEVFREAFQRHKREDLLQKLDLFLPEGFLGEVNYVVGQDDISRKLKDDLQRHPASLVVVRLYTYTKAHTLVLEINADSQRFGFYNSSLAGYYAYEDLHSFVHALTGHVASHSDFLKENSHARWDLDFYLSRS